MVKRHRTRLALAGAALATVATLVAAPAALAQAKSGDANLTVRSIDGTDAEHVSVTFLWTGDPNALSGMTIREDGQDRKVEDLTVLRKTEQRLATVYLVDLSGSMGDDGQLAAVKTGLAKAAAQLPDGDQMAVVGFNDTAVVETAFTSDPDQLDDAVEAMAAPRDGKTATYDGIREAVSLFGDRPNLQPNLVLITDGADDASKANLDQALASVVQSGAALFAVDLQHEQATDAAAIDSIVSRTGGVRLPAATDGVADAVDAVDVTMRSQYVASYASTAEQGEVTVGVSIDGVEQVSSYVVGNTATGAATTKIAPTSKAWGSQFLPDWLNGSAGAALAFVLVGLAAGLGTFAVASLVTKSDTSLSAVLRPYDEEGVQTEDDDDQALAQTALLQRAVAMTEDFAERQGFLEKVEHLLERADLPLRAAEALFFYLAAVVVGGLLSLVGLGVAPGLMVTILIALLPPAVVNFLAGLRSKKFVGQLPDTLNLLSGSLRAGYSLMQGVEAVSQEVAEPMGHELRRVITESRLGREIEDAMDAVAERMDSPDFAWAVMAIRIQREVGGNLSELLLTVADTMVHRDRLRRDVAALTAEGKISAIILGLLPIGLGAFMWLSNPTYMAPLSETGLGQGMLGLAIVSAGVGFLWMKKTISIEI